MSDYIVKAIAANGFVRAAAAVSTRTVETARRIHDLSPAAAQGLGRLMTAGAIMASSLGKGQSVTLRVMADGPLGGMIVVADADGGVKGYVYNPHVEVPLDEERMVQRALGRKGYLYVTYDLGLKEPYTGSVRLVNSEIAQDLTAYFYRSEQIPSLIALGTFLEPRGVAAAGGIIIQMMPGADEYGYPDLLKEIAREIPPVSKMIRGKVTPEEIISLYLGRMEPVVVERLEFGFRCSCSRRKIARILRGFPVEENREILAREGKIEALCHFCSRKYVFTPAQVEKLMEGKRRPPAKKAAPREE